MSATTSPLRRPVAQYKLSLRVEPERGGPVRQSVRDDGGLVGSGARHLLLVVHGFNKTNSSAEEDYDRLLGLLVPGLAGLRDGPDSLATLQWPGDVAVGPFEFLDFAGYPVDIRQAQESAARLVEYVIRLAGAAPGGWGLQVSVIGHSLGCRLLLEALSAANWPVQRARLDVLALMAAAAPVALALPGQRFSALAGRARTLLNRYSTDDWVVWLAFPAGQLLARAMNIEPAFYATAIGATGDPPGYGIATNTGNSHGAYWSDGRTVDEIVDALNVASHRLPSRVAAQARPLLPTREIPGRVVPA